MLQYIVLWSLFSNVCKEKEEKKKRRKEEKKKRRKEEKKKRRKEDKGGEKGEKEMVQLPSPAL